MDRYAAILCSVRLSRPAERPNNCWTRSATDSLMSLPKSPNRSPLTSVTSPGPPPLTTPPTQLFTLSNIREHLSTIIRKHLSTSCSTSTVSRSTAVLCPGRRREEGLRLPVPTPRHRSCHGWARQYISHKCEIKESRAEEGARREPGRRRWFRRAWALSRRQAASDPPSAWINDFRTPRESLPTQGHRGGGM